MLNFIRWLAAVKCHHTSMPPFSLFLTASILLHEEYFRSVRESCLPEIQLIFTLNLLKHLFLTTAAILLLKVKNNVLRWSYQLPVSDFHIILYSSRRIHNKRAFRKTKRPFTFPYSFVRQSFTCYFTVAFLTVDHPE